MNELLLILLQICTPLLVALIGWGVKALVNKLDAAALVDLDKLTNDIVLQAVAAVEQLSMTLEKNNEVALASNDKLAKAMVFINQQLEAMGLKKIAAELLKQKIEAVLFNNTI